MIALAEVLRRHWPAYEAKFSHQLLPSHRRAVAAILSCRTPRLGGQLDRCDCGQFHYAYHSCHHRACPQCGHAEATQWIARQHSKLLPVPYFLVTFTVPEELRALIRSHQKILYARLFRESAGTLEEIAAHPRHLGAQLGMLGVLHTWQGRALTLWRFAPKAHWVQAPPACPRACWVAAFAIGCAARCSRNSRQSSNKSRRRSGARIGSSTCNPSAPDKGR